MNEIRKILFAVMGLAPLPLVIGVLCWTFAGCGNGNDPIDPCQTLGRLPGCAEPIQIVPPEPMNNMADAAIMDLADVREYLDNSVLALSKQHHNSNGSSVGITRKIVKSKKLSKKNSERSRVARQSTKDFMNNTQDTSKVSDNVSTSPEGADETLIKDVETTERIIKDNNSKSNLRFISNAAQGKSKKINSMPDFSRMFGGSSFGRRDSNNRGLSSITFESFQEMPELFRRVHSRYQVLNLNP